MTEAEAKFISEGMTAIRNDMNSRFDGLSQDVKDVRSELIKDIVDKCDTCTNAPSFNARLTEHWWHIVAIWGVIAAMGASMFAGLWYQHNQFNDHRLNTERPAIQEKK